jgi:GNAT superfamily N-acetyltransferase
MKANTGSGLKNRGGGKSRQGGGSVTVTKSVPRKTKDVNESVIILRNAIFTPTGADKDITEGIVPAFLKYDRNDLNLAISFSPKLSRAELTWAFQMTKENMEDVYETSGYGWDDDDKMRELTEQGTRFLLIREKSEDGSAPGPLRGFAHFRFTVQGEVLDMMAGEPCIYLWDIQLEESIQRKGVGKHILTLLDLIGRREQMKYLSIPIQLMDETSTAWILKNKGYAPDELLSAMIGFDSEVEVSLYFYSLSFILISLL